jgi:hypothetical protein
VLRGLWSRAGWCCGCGWGLGCYDFVVCYAFPCFGIEHTKRESRFCGVFVFSWCAILWQGERGVVVFGSLLFEGAGRGVRTVCRTVYGMGYGIGYRICLGYV